VETTLAHKAYVITGATSGIGLATAQLLSARGACVIGVGRSAERCQQAEQTMVPISVNSCQVRYLVADLSVQAEVRHLARQVEEILDGWDHPPLDGLINNAATVPFWQTLTPEGFDLQWAVNHLAPFLLTAELLPRLRAASMARVVTVSSGSHRHGRLEWDDIQLLHHYSPLKAYSLTKLANVLFTIELNRRLEEGSSVRAFAADPGLVNTQIGLKSNSWIARRVWDIRRRGGVTPSRSSAGIVFLATEPSIQNARDVYWKNGKPVSPSPRATNMQSARQLWNLSAQMCGLAA
jgi:NAD(P)-dependent dehydrogenase (short-subunit alcohol dehydrogenase family)